MPQTNRTRAGMKLRGYHHGRLMELLDSPDHERKFPCFDHADADVMIHSLLRLRRVYGYEITIIQDGRDVWVCKPGSPLTQAPQGQVSTADAAERAGIKYKTFLARMRKLGIKSMRVGKGAFITLDEAAQIAASGRGAG